MKKEVEVLVLRKMTAREKKSTAVDLVAVVQLQSEEQTRGRKIIKVV